MKNKRNIFEELMNGLNELRLHREGKITLRTYVLEQPSQSNFDADMKAFERINHQYYNAFYELTDE